MASSAMDQPLGHEHRPAPRRLRAWLRKLTGAWAGADSRRRRAWLALGRMFKLVVLLALIVVALTSTTVLDRPSQVFLLKAFLVCFLSLLPGWLYLQFIAVKGTGLYDEYVLNLYRLRIDDVANLPKPPPGSRYWAWWKEAVAPDLDPARNIYLKKFEAVYGRSAVPQSRRQHDLDDDDTAGTTARLFERIHADAFSPVIMATALLCVGWIIVVEPEPFRGVRLLGGLALTGLPRMPDQALRFGFIGSYAFIMQSLVRRYFQADLKTHAYLSAIARVILVAALITAIHPLWSTWRLPGETELAFGFFLGFFPELGLRVIQRSLVGLLRKSRPAEEGRFPLRQLDGANIWVQARFLEEGIEDMQNLATANLVDLMLSTRTPINRLLDWIDQAFLYLRVCDGQDGDGPARRVRQHRQHGPQVPQGVPAPAERRPGRHRERHRGPSQSARVGDEPLARTPVEAAHLAERPDGVRARSVAMKEASSQCESRTRLRPPRGSASPSGCEATSRRR